MVLSAIVPGVHIVPSTRDHTLFFLSCLIISNSNWTEWSTIQRVIARVISKSDEREARGRFEITSTITPFITCRAKLLNADWLRQRAFFLNQEGTFGNQEGMITWCWFAERACSKLVSGFKPSLKRNFRNASLLSLILTRSFHLNVKENQHAKERSLFVEKERIFPSKTVLIRSLKTVLSGDGWCWRKY